MWSFPVIARERKVGRVRELLRDYPVVALLSARQVGKTTLAGQVARTYAKPHEW
jgi:predicted AAA+ superfamily ATPase